MARTLFKLAFTLVAAMSLAAAEEIPPGEMIHWWSFDTPDGDLVADQPQFPRLRSDPTAISGASRKKRFPSSKRFSSSQPKSDGWAGDYYLGERTKLFSFIFENNTSGVIGISGDVHRSDIYKLPIGKERYFYDFTSGSLSRTHRTPPNPLPQEMIHSYGKETDNNM